MNVVAEEPPVCQVYFYFSNQLAFTANSIEIADEKNFEQDYWIYAGASVVFAIKMLHLISNEFKIKYSIDFPQKVILRNQLLKADEFKLWLFWCYLQHNDII